MKTRTKIIIGAIAVVIIAAIAFWLNYQNSVQDYRDMVAGTTYQNIDASLVPDGVYIGEYNVDFIYAKVSVTVTDGNIVSIELLEHRNDRGASAEGIIDEIVAQQKIDVDAISGATNSSTVIKKAVDNALTNALAEQ